MVKTKYVAIISFLLLIKRYRQMCVKPLFKRLEMINTDALTSLDQVSGYISNVSKAALAQVLKEACLTRRFH